MRIWLNLDFFFKYFNLHWVLIEQFQVDDKQRPASLNKYIYYSWLQATLSA